MPSHAGDVNLERLRSRTAWTRVANERAYDAPADPWATVDVDPSAVEYFTRDCRLNWGLGRVRGGDWDRPEHCGRVRDVANYEGLVQRFAEGKDWTETVLYERASEQFVENGSFRGYDSLEAFRAVRLSYLDDLYETIRDEGYRPNREAAHEPPTDENAFETAYAHRLEPLVAIGRDGEVVWAEGYHRLAIAAVLGLDSIPVQVVRRHVEWQRVRDRVARAGRAAVPDGVDPDHPDLRDVTP